MAFCLNRAGAVLFLCVTGLLLLHSTASAEETRWRLPGSAVEEPAPKLRKSREASSPRFPGFARYQGAMREICTVISLDGRREEFYSLLIKHTDRRNDCSACRPFFRSFASVCRPPKVRRRLHTTKEEQDDPIVHHRQREPHMVVLTLTTLLFQQMAADERIAGEASAAVRLFLETIRDVESRSGASVDYFTILAAFAEAPFKKLLKSAEREDGDGAERPGNWFEDRGAVDGLFDY